jgi:hypothetical protein
MRGRLTPFLAASVLALPQPATARGGADIVAFNLPGGKPTCGHAIALDGTVLGTSGSTVNPGVSFIYAKGRFAVLKPLLPAGNISFGGVNMRHELAGAGLPFSGQGASGSEAFTFQGGVTNVITIANALSAAATGINDAGTLIGYYQTSAGGVSYGFVKQTNTLVTLDAGAGSTIPEAINDTGTVVVGLLLGPTGSVTSWLYQNGAYAAIAYPHASSTLVAGVYGPGWVTGTYFTGTAPALTAHGFHYHAGLYAPFDVAGARQTQVAGANALGQFTGCFMDVKGTHGFVATPK